MPADDTLPQASSTKHGNGSAPYPCHAGAEPPNADWAINYGYCRTSLDHQPPGYMIGSSDPRCPRDCQHKAPQVIAVRFTKAFMAQGAKAAAAMSVKHRTSNPIK